MNSLSTVLLISMTLVGLPSLTRGQIHDETPIELSGFSVSETYDIKDDLPLDLDAQPIERLLYRLRSSSPRTRAHYSQFSRTTSWDEIINQTDEFRMRMFDRPGRVKKIESHHLATATLDTDIQQFYVCHGEFTPEFNPDSQSEKPHPFMVITRTIPAVLPLGEPIDEPVRVLGFLYLRTIDSNNQKIPVFVSDRLAWFPDRSQPNGATTSQVALAAHGVDIGQFDLVRENNAKPLGQHDAETFFQMISGVAQMPPLDENQPRLSFYDLIKKGDQKFGHAAKITGSVRTCSRVTITDRDIQDRLGVRQYYQLMVFPNLNGKKISIEHRDGTQTEYSRFPITVICTELPEGMSPGDLEKQRIQVDGFFFRYWSFRSGKSDQTWGTGQPSPLLISRRPTLLASNVGYLNSFLIGFVVVVSASVAALVIGLRIKDRRKGKRMTPLVDQLPEQIDVSGINELP